MNPWQPMSTAPKDGRKVDLMFWQPLGRKINYAWDEKMKAWGERIPTYDVAHNEHALLPEDQWRWRCYPNAEPYAWMEPPPHPGEIEHSDPELIAQIVKVLDGR